MELLENNRYYYSMPSSTVCNLMAEIITAGDRLSELSKRKKQISHSTAYSVFGNEQNRRLVKIENEKNNFSIDIDDIRHTCNGKLFTLLLIKICSQAVFNGQIERNEICFPVQELIDLGIYRTPQSARKGLTDAVAAISGMRLKGELHPTKKTTYRLEGALFTGMTVKKGLCHISLNTDFDWKAVTQYFTILPSFYFRLSSRASTLLYSICCLARQNADKIAENGYFNISLRTIQQKLMLPSDTKNPKRDIWDVIDNTINEIIAAQSEYDIAEIVPAVCGNRSIETGYLRISVSGQAAETFAKYRRSQKQVNNINNKTTLL